MKKGNPFADTAATQQFLKAVGDSRVTVSEINGMAQLGTPIDQMELMLQRLGSGKVKFTEPMRRQMLQTVMSLESGVKSTIRKQLEPLYNNTTKASPGVAQAMREGRIFRPQSLELFGEKSSAPSQQKKPQESKGPVTLQPTEIQMKVIKAQILKGSKISDIEKQLSKKIGRPVKIDPASVDILGGK